MQVTAVVWAFYKKLFFPALLAALLFAALLLTGDEPNTRDEAWSLTGLLQRTGGLYIVFGLLFHLIVYEVFYPQEYYFYHNLGWSKLRLWMVSAGITLTFGLLLGAL